jgi:tetratricopeptide (TPR) repeat protein
MQRRHPHPLLHPPTARRSHGAAARSGAAALLLVVTLALSGCQSSEEKAEAFYQSGLQLLAAGDEDRALVEFRNVFEYNGFHKEARKTYADILLKRGEYQEAYGQYLRLIEQYPDMVEVRHTLAETAFDLGDWDQVGLHGQAASKLAPEDPRSRAILLALDYRQAVMANDAAAQARLGAASAEFVKSAPDSLVARRVLIDWLMVGDAPQSAMPEIDAALTLDPDNFSLHSMKLNLLGQIGVTPEFGAQLRIMVDLFPTNEDLKRALVSWYMSQDDLDNAEAFLRSEAKAETAGLPERIALVQFLTALRSRDAARAELAALIAADAQSPDANLYRALVASMDFEDGETAKAITEMEAILASAVPSDQTRDIEIILSDMLRQTGQDARSDALIAKVLGEDPTNVAALKARATRLISQDRMGDAIVDLRAAQNQSPDDPEIMTLLASAFQRDGSLDLAGEQLAKAFKATGSAPEQALRYAAFLRSQGRDAVAETVLTDARRVSPNDPDILLALAELALQAGKWAAAEELAGALRQIDQPETTRQAQQIDAAILLGQDKIDEGIDLLADQASASSGDLRALAVVMTAQMRNGKTDEAAALLADALAKTPESAELRLMDAQMDAVLGRPAEAETKLRALIEEAPQADAPVRLLFGLLSGQGRAEDADAVLTAALTRQPANATLLWLQAGRLEQKADFDGAIAIYETLYAQNSGDLIIANNLASLLTTYRDDPASLDRAANIARRLRGSEVPALQDTYGWIEYRRGNLNEALRYLEPAAKALSSDPVVQFHLGMVYADLGRADEAATQFRLALDLGKDRSLPQLETAKQRLAEIEAAPQP